MEAAFDDLAIEPRRRALRPRQQRRRRLRRRAHAGAARRRRRRSSCSAASRTCSGDARINLEVLGRIGMTVVEITNAQEWELHFTELSDCDLIVDAHPRHRLSRPPDRLARDGRRRLNALGVPVVAIDLPTGALGRHADARRAGDRGVDDGDARRRRRFPLVFPPADTHAGDLVIADIGIPLPLLDELEGPHLELLTRERMREHRADARRRLAQGRLRPRADRRRIARAQTGAAHLAGARRAALGRRAGHGRDAALVPADRRRRWRPST